MESWQERSNTHSERMAHLLKTGVISDVTFIVGIPPESKTYKLHKVILSMCSDVFLTMFYGSMSEIDEIQVSGISPRIFDITMKYVYEELFSVQSMEQAMNTYCTADKYNIAELRKLCVTYIIQHLYHENVPLLYKMPNLLEESQIKSKCEKILSEKASAILESNDFLKSPLEMVKDMIQLDNLNIDREEKLFDFLLNWAKEEKKNNNFKQKDLRTIMDNFLLHIRFLAMTVEGFLSGPGNSGILTDSEIAQIASNLVTPGLKKLPSWCSKAKSRIKQYSNPNERITGFPWKPRNRILPASASSSSGTFTFGDVTYTRQ